MKKSLKLLILTSAFAMLLSGCNGGNPTTSEQTCIEDTCCEPNSDIWNLGYTAQDVYDMLKNAADTGNYTLEYQYMNSLGGMTKYYEYYHQDYAYFTASNAGYIALPDYKVENEKIYYIYELDRNYNLILKQPLTSTDPVTDEVMPVRNTDTLDYMRLFNNELADINVCDILSYQKGYYTDNDDLILILVNLLGYGSYIHLVDKITFQIENGGLRFTLMPNFKDGYELIDGENAVIKDVGTTKHEYFEEYLSDYELPKTTLNNEIVNLFNQDVVSLSANVSRIWTTTGAVELQKTKLDVSEDQAYFEKIYGDPYYGQLTTPVKKLYKKGDNGNAFNVYINTQNELVNEDTNTLFDKMFIEPSLYLEANAFRSNDGINYHYYGYNSRKLIKALANYDLGVIESVDMKIVDGKVKQIVATTPYYSDLVGGYFCTQAVITLDETRTIPVVAPFEVSAETSSIETTLNYFDGNTSFKADIVTNGDELYKTTITVSNGILLIEENGFDTDAGASEEIIKIYSGYQETNNGLVPFKVTLEENEQGVITGVAKASDHIIPSETLEDAIGMTATAEVFSKNNDGQIVLNSLVDKIEDGFIDTYYTNGLVPSSLVMDVDNMNHVSHIFYNYENDDGYYLGEEEISFYEWETASLPEHIDFSDIGLWVEPSSWKDELNASTYELFVSVFGEEYVSRVPYIYRKELFGAWQIDYNLDVGGEYLHLFAHEVDCPAPLDDTYMKEFATEFANMLLELGYVETNENAWGLMCFHKDDINIRIVYNSELVDFFIFRNL